MNPETTASFARRGYLRPVADGLEPLVVVESPDDRTVGRKRLRATLQLMRDTDALSIGELELLEACFQTDRASFDDIGRSVGRDGKYVIETLGPIVDRVRECYAGSAADPGEWQTPPLDWLPPRRVTEK